MRLEDLIVLCTMGPPGGGRTFITNRLVRHFNMLAYTDLPSDIINSIFTSLLAFYLRKFPEPVRHFDKHLSETCLSVFEFVKSELLPTPSKSHYTFNLRDIWKVVQGICAANPKGIQSTKALIHLWYHENMRVYHDRLVNK
jgi:dynein heavy chain